MRARAAALALAACALVAGRERPETFVHVVQPGETLSSISAQPDVYADPYLWPVIYRFNRDQIQNPAVIYPNQRLQIPIHVDLETRRSTRAVECATEPLIPRGIGESQSSYLLGAGASARD